MSQTPSDDGALELREPAHKAGGIPAIVSTARHILSKSGPIKGTRALLRVNQLAGFDCPGCAWPDPAHRTTTEFCENGAKAVADEVMNADVDRRFFARYSISELQQQTDHWLNKQGRIAEPMVRRGDHYEPIEWSVAFSMIARHLNRMDSPDRAVFYTSGRTSNEAAFLYQLFVRELGTNNMPDCSNMCHESSGVGLTEVIGIGKGTVLLEDFDKAGLIIVMGQNPGTNHPRMLTALQSAKRLGAKIVTVNPLREAGSEAFIHPQEVSTLFGAGTSLTDVFVPVRVNGDVAFLKAVMRRVLERDDESPGIVAREFIANKTAGWSEFEADLRGSDFDVLVAESGVDASIIDEVSALVATHDNIIVCWAMGLTQQKNGVANIQEVANLLLMRGAIGKPGAGACPVRGHSNVQGDRTVGIVEKPSAKFLDAMEKHFGIAMPREHGFDTVAAIKAMARGDVDVFFGMGGNFLSASPDTEFTAAALQRCKLTVHVSTKLNRSHLVTGEDALILPCLGRSEIDIQDGPQFVTVENSMGIVHASRGGNKPASSSLMSEPAIVCGLARATTPESPIDWEAFARNYDLVRDAIEACIPGFENYNARVRTPGGFALPNGPREGVFPTPDGKAHFTVHPLPSHDLRPDELVMMTIRTHDQYNTTVYGLDDRYRGIYQGRRVVLMNASDMAKRGIVTGQHVDLASRFGDQIRHAERFVAVPYEIPPGCAATYFPEANVLVAVDSVADRSHTPTSKYVVITVTPSASI
ncbi:MAG: FdhF/YdeP family oxidoreductase [bacterium]